MRMSGETFTNLMDFSDLSKFKFSVLYCKSYTYALLIYLSKFLQPNL